MRMTPFFPSSPSLSPFLFSVSPSHFLSVYVFLYTYYSLSICVPLYHSLRLSNMFSLRLCFFIPYSSMSVCPFLLSSLPCFINYFQSICLSRYAPFFLFVCLSVGICYSLSVSPSNIICLCFIFPLVFFFSSFPTFN